MLAVVVDDHDMGVTHIIRGDDHLTNAARQTLIYQGARLADVPVMAHIPLIHGPDGAKLSKRHGALGVGGVSRHGLPGAGRDAQLSRPAWLEPRRRGDLLHRADDRVVRVSMPSGSSPSRFDFRKLENLNGHYMRATDDSDALMGGPSCSSLPHLPKTAPASRACASGRGQRGCRMQAPPCRASGTAPRRWSNWSTGRRVLCRGPPARSCWTRRRRKASGSPTVPARSWPPSTDAPCGPVGEWSHRKAPGGGRCAIYAEESDLKARQGGPAPPRRPHRPRHVAGYFRRSRRSRPRGIACPASPTRPPAEPASAQALPSVAGHRLFGRTGHLPQRPRHFHAERAVTL